MIKLEELIYSLATVIIRYHDSQRTTHPLIAEIDPLIHRTKSRELAIYKMQTQEIKYDEYLKSLIENCTKGSPDRLHFLNFILHEINFFKAQLERKNPLNELEFELYQKQTTQLFIDFIQLLSTLKGKTYKVSYSALTQSNTCIALSGLINNAYFGNNFCNSGQFLIEEVFERFHLNPSCKFEQIKKLSTSICHEHQNALLVTTFQDQKPVIVEAPLEPELLKFEVATQTDQEPSSHEEHIDSVETSIEEQPRIIEFGLKPTQLQESIQTGLKPLPSDLGLQQSTLHALTLELSEAHLAQQNILELAKTHLEQQKILELAEAHLEQKTLLKLLATHLEQQKIIENLERELRKTQSELYHVQLELEQKQKELEKKPPLPYPFFPHASLFGLNTLRIFNPRGPFDFSQVKPRETLSQEEKLESKPQDPEGQLEEEPISNSL